MGKKNKKYTYSISWSYTIGKVKTFFVTQLYDSGVYLIINNDLSLQFSISPEALAKVQEQLKKNPPEGLTFGRQITVQEAETKVWKEIK